MKTALYLCKTTGDFVTLELPDHIEVRPCIELRYPDDNYESREFWCASVTHTPDHNHDAKGVYANCPGCGTVGGGL